MRTLSLLVKATAVTAALTLSSAAHSFSVFVFPELIEREPGSLSFDIVGEYFGPAELAGGSFDLQFDPSMLQLELINISGFTFSEVGDVNNQTGVINDISFADFFGMTGRFTIASLEFSVVSSGEALIQFLDATTFSVPGQDNYEQYPWLNYDYSNGPFGEDVTPLFFDGSIAVSTEVPVPAAAWLFASALVSLGLKRKVK